MKRKKIEEFGDQMARLFPQPIDPNDKERHLIRTVTWQVTDGCNLRCTYCYQINKKNHIMSWDVAKRFCDMLLDATKENNDYINPDLSPGLIMEFIGGEPFLAVDLIDQICDYMVSEMIKRQHPWATRYMISICSNGVLYFDPKVQAFLKKWRDHLSFSITVDGCKELHDACRVFPDGSGSYDLAIAGVQHYKDVLHGEMGSKMTIAPGNVQYVLEAVKNFVSQGYTDINLNCVYEEGWTTEHAKVLYEQLVKAADYLLENNLDEEVLLSIFQETFFHPKDESDDQNWCGGLGSMLSCDWKGDLYPCIRYMESSLGENIEPVKVGNVYDGILSTAQERQTFECMKCITRRSQSTDECYYCPIAEGCSWCFPAGTKIRTPNGYENIENLKENDEVIDMNGDIQKVENCLVREVSSSDLILIKPFDKEEIIVTKEHPFFVKTNGSKDGQWVAAKDIFLTDELAEFTNNKEEPIKWIKIEKLLDYSSSNDSKELIKVYNLTVSNTHTFIADDIIVHNCSAYNYQDTGSYNKRATHICIMHKARALANAYFWNMKYMLRNEPKVMHLYIPDDWAIPIIGEEELNKLKTLEEMCLNRGNLNGNQY